MKASGLAALALSFALCAPTGALGEAEFVYEGMCDASAAVALGANHFIVADNERNTLMIYRRGKKAPAQAVDLSSFLGTKPGKESDLEGAASLGDITYWISSHGRSADGEEQKRRYRFFATEVRSGRHIPSVSTTGVAYASLLIDLMRAPHLAVFKLADAAASKPEENGGLNIEGLASTPDAKLLIGFRNPIRDGKALLVPLENPMDLIAGKAARFGAGIQLDLDGRGIRSIDRVGSAYLIVAGPPANVGTFMLYRWSGDPPERAGIVAGIEFTGLHPEALFAVPNSDTVQILSDDGDIARGTKACKHLPRSKQSFRSVTVRP